MFVFAGPLSLEKPKEAFPVRTMTVPPKERAHERTQQTERIPPSPTAFDLVLEAVADMGGGWVLFLPPLPFSRKHACRGSPVNRMPLPETASEGATSLGMWSSAKQGGERTWCADADLSHAKQEPTRRADVGVSVEPRPFSPAANLTTGRS